MLLLLALTGCRSLVPLPEPEYEPPGEPTAEPVREPPPKRVLLVVGSDQPSLQAVFDAISKQLAPRKFDAVSS